MADLDGPGDAPGGINARDVPSERSGLSAGETSADNAGTNAGEMPTEKTGMGPDRAPVKSHGGAFARKVGQKEERKIRARQERGKGIWFGLGTMGMIGWSVAVPTLIGVALGAWLDSRYPGQISWTLTFLSIGLAVGCANAWYWVRRQQKGISGGEGSE